MSITGHGFEARDLDHPGHEEYFNGFRQREDPPTTKTDIFRPIFDELEKAQGGKQYGSTPPRSPIAAGQIIPTSETGKKWTSPFRVIADHNPHPQLSPIPPDGIQPGNTDRQLTSSAASCAAPVRYGRTPRPSTNRFFYKLVAVPPPGRWGDVFPEVRAEARKQCRGKCLKAGGRRRSNRTLDRGICCF